MPRSDWRAITAFIGVACFGVGAFTASLNYPKADNLRPSETASALNKVNEPEAHRPGCKRDEDDRSSDLCAQWKAADAADSSADATWWTVYFAGAGIALGAITMAAAISAAYFAKQAADETKRSADAAHGANRPWLDVDVKMHGVIVSYDRKGYLLQLELMLLNAGASPANDVREQVDCVFYEHIPEGDPLALDLAPRDQTLQSRADAVANALRREREAGPTVFPARDHPIYIETFVPWDWSDGYPTPIAWLVVGLRYSFPDGIGESLKVFSVRSFGFPDHNGFDLIGTDAGASANTDAVIAAWPRHGYVK